MIDATGRVIVSNSTLRDVATCAQADIARHRDLLTGIDTSGPRTLGAVWHEVVAAHFQGASDPLAKLEPYREFSDRVCVPETWVDVDGTKKSKLNRCRYENVRPIAEGWLKAHPVERLPYRVNPKLVEVAFLLPIGPFWIRGRLDALVEDDGLWVHENKTTGRLDANFWRQWRMDSALTGYCWAAQETLGESIQGVIVEGVQMSEVPRSSRKCPTHGMPYAECGSEFHLVWGMERFKRSASDMRGWKLDVIGLATQHHSNMTADWAAQGGVPQDGKFHGACYKYEGFAACDFAEWCEAGRPTDFTPALLGLEQVKEH